MRYPAPITDSPGPVVNRKLLLIDYENIKNFDLTLLGEEVDIVIFVGARQTITSKLSVPAKKLGSRLAPGQDEPGGCFVATG